MFPMAIVWGTRPYGKTDHVEGHCYVATRFFHLWYIPLIPLGSQLIEEGSETMSEYLARDIDWNAKSVLHAYLRGWGLLLGVVSPFAFLGSGIPVALISTAFFWGIAGYSKWQFTKADEERAAEVLQKYLTAEHQPPDYLREEVLADGNTAGGAEAGVEAAPGQEGPTPPHGGPKSNEPPPAAARGPGGPTNDGPPGNETDDSKESPENIEW